MHYTEIIFFGCFIVFIVGILMLDMLVIDKEAHEVSMKEAGAWTAVWITLALLFSVFLWFHGDLVHGINNFSDLPVSPVYVQAVRERGLDVVGRSKWNNTLLVRVASEKQLARLKELPFVVRMTKVFTAPDSVDKRVRSSFHKEFNKWDSSTADEYGSTRESS